MVENFNQTKATQPKLKHIAVTNDVYEQLRNQGKVGDSFNDVVKRLLRRELALSTESLKDKRGQQ